MSVVAAHGAPAPPLRRRSPPLPAYDAARPPRPSRPPRPGVSMVRVGDFELRLVRTDTRTACPEVTAPDGRTYAVAAPGAPFNVCISRFINPADPYSALVNHNVRVTGASAVAGFVGAAGPAWEREQRAEEGGQAGPCRRRRRLASAPTSRACPEQVSLTMDGRSVGYSCNLDALHQTVNFAGFLQQGGAQLSGRRAEELWAGVWLHAGEGLHRRGAGTRRQRLP